MQRPSSIPSQMKLFSQYRTSSKMSLDKQTLAKNVQSDVKKTQNSIQSV